MWFFFSRGWIEITEEKKNEKNNGSVLEAQSKNFAKKNNVLFCFFFENQISETNHDGATRFSFPPCVDDLSCPDSVVLIACLCSFCHTKATSSASAHNCLIPHNAKLELFALLQMIMGILRCVQFAILI